MPAELVIVAPTHPTTGEVAAAIAELHPDAVMVGWRDATITQVITADGRPILTIFPPHPIELVTEAEHAIGARVPGMSMWLEATIPLGQEDAGWEVAQRIAERVGGQAHRRV